MAIDRHSEPGTRMPTKLPPHFSAYSLNFQTLSTWADKPFWQQNRTLDIGKDPCKVQQVLTTKTKTKTTKTKTGLDKAQRLQRQARIINTLVDAAASNPSINTDPKALAALRDMLELVGSRIGEGKDVKIKHIRGPLKVLAEAQRDSEADQVFKQALRYDTACRAVVKDPSSIGEKPLANALSYLGVAPQPAVEMQHGKALDAFRQGLDTMAGSAKSRSDWFARLQKDDEDTTEAQWHNALTLFKALGDGKHGSELYGPAFRAPESPDDTVPAVTQRAAAALKAIDETPVLVIRNLETARVGLERALHATLAAPGDRAAESELLKRSFAYNLAFEAAVNAIHGLAQALSQPTATFGPLPEEHRLWLQALGRDLSGLVLQLLDPKMPLGDVYQLSRWMEKRLLRGTARPIVRRLQEHLSVLAPESVSAQAPIGGSQEHGTSSAPLSRIPSVQLIEPEWLEDDAPSGE